MPAIKRTNFSGLRWGRDSNPTL